MLQVSSLPIRDDLSLPLAEIELRTSRSSGPGGQHANVTASRVEAVFDVPASATLSEAQKSRICARLGPRVTAAAQDTRSQHQNRELALDRLARRLASALEVRRPRTIELRDEPLPKSGAGKVLKTRLREPVWDGRERRVN